MNALIQDGVTIGEGAIVAPASVVVTDVAPNVVVSGFPALPWRERKQPAKPAGRDAGAPRTTRTASESDRPGSEIRQTAADRAGLLDRVRGYFEEYRYAEFGESGLADSDSLFDNDILDSVELVALVAWLEKAFDLEIHEDDLIPDNLDSVERIAQFVHDRRTTRSE